MKLNSGMARDRRYHLIYLQSTSSAKLTKKVINSKSSKTLLIIGKTQSVQLKRPTNTLLREAANIKKTTTGWDLEVEWKDDTTSWLPLKTLKETNPIQVAEYAKANKIDSEPAFDWWVPVVMRQKTRLIASE